MAADTVRPLLLWQTQRAQPGQQRRRRLGGAPVSVRREEAGDGASQVPPEVHAQRCERAQLSGRESLDTATSWLICFLIRMSEVLLCLNPSVSRLSDVLKKQGS